MPTNGPAFIDAFAGCGGLSLGLLRAGWNGLFAIEKDAFAFETLETNLISCDGKYRFSWPNWLSRQPWAVEALMQEHRERLLELRGEVDLLAGGPPCQGFSSAGRRRYCDPRNELVERYLEFVELVLPRMVLIENVRGITYDFVAGEGVRKNFSEELIYRLEESYEVFFDTIRCSEFGVPQLRPRFFLVGIRKSCHKELQARLDQPFGQLRRARKAFLDRRGLRSMVTCKDAISDFEAAYASRGPCPDSDGYEAIICRSPITNYQAFLRDGFEGPVSDTRLAKHRPHTVKRFQDIITECHATGRLHVQLNRAMRQRYGLNKRATRVLDPTKPAPTITSMPDDLLHYAEPRTLTVRENARLQTFPDWFRFKGKYTTGGEKRAREVPRFTQVANAVPPLVAELWGEVLMEYALLMRASATGKAA